jgi:hypothetical protein
MSLETPHEEDHKKNAEKESAITRSEILKKARDAKKRKNEEIFNQTEYYTKNLENIHAHLTNLNTQMTSLVSVVREIQPKRFKTETTEKIIETPPPPSVHVAIAKEDEETPIKRDFEGSIISSKYSYILGEAVAGALAAGALFYFKSRAQKSPYQKIHERYSKID